MEQTLKKKKKTNELNAPPVLPGREEITLGWKNYKMFPRGPGISDDLKRVGG